MHGRPAVSVAICLLNSSRFIDDTLASVFAQTFDDYEIILVDDGSTDGCADVLERRYRGRGLRIIRQRHQGLSIARRVSIAAAAGEFVAFLDHDDLWVPDKLERQIAAADAEPASALLFSDCEYINERGEPVGRVSDHYRLSGVDLSGTRGYAELLRRGCFVWQSTVLARTSALRSVNSFDLAYPYIADYDTWLQLARRYPIHYTPHVLAKWRVHANQFTNRCPEITLADHRRLLGPLFYTASNPRPIRIALGDRLLGQHRVSCRNLLKQKRFGMAARAAFGMASYPDRLLAYCLGTIAETAIVGRPLVSAYKTIRRVLRAPQYVARILKPVSIPTHVWIDGSVLARSQTGYFSLVAELIRTLAVDDGNVVHVVTSGSGRDALRRRLNEDIERIHFHPIGWRALRWADIDAVMRSSSARALVLVGWVLLIAAGLAFGVPPFLFVGAAVALFHVLFELDEVIADVRTKSGSAARRISSRVIRRLWRFLASPRGRPPHSNTVEVVVWRGRFRWAESRHIAIVQDLTTRIHPELHTRENVAELDEFLDYVQRQAESIATVSEHSRRDIINQLAHFPDSVSVIPMPLHPGYFKPVFDRAFVEMYGITQPYVLSVGCIEPRKNLRRLVRAFELLKDEEAARDLVLVLAGPKGWDEEFDRFLIDSDAHTQIRKVGFVALEHMPSLYHFASAVIYPSVYEGFGLPVLEAMAASGIVLAAAASSLPEVLGDGITFDPYRTDDIAATMLQALNMSPAEAAAYRRRCRARAEQFLQDGSKLPPLPGLPARATVTFA